MAATNSRTVLISGASSGIGRATSELLLQGGNQVIGIGRDFSKYKYPCKGFTQIEMDLGNIKVLPEQLTDQRNSTPLLTVPVRVVSVRWRGRKKAAFIAPANLPCVALPRPCGRNVAAVVSMSALSTPAWSEPNSLKNLTSSLARIVVTLLRLPMSPTRSK